MVEASNKLSWHTILLNVIETTSFVHIIASFNVGKFVAFSSPWQVCFHNLSTFLVGMVTICTIYICEPKFILYHKIQWYDVYLLHLFHSKHNTEIHLATGHVSLWTPNRCDSVIHGRFKEDSYWCQFSLPCWSLIMSRGGHITHAQSCHHAG